MDKTPTDPRPPNPEGETSCRARSARDVLVDLRAWCAKNEGEDADETLARMRGLLDEAISKRGTADHVCVKCGAPVPTHSSIRICEKCREGTPAEPFAWASWREGRPTSAAQLTYTKLTDDDRPLYLESGVGAVQPPAPEPRGWVDAFGDVHRYRTDIEADRVAIPLYEDTPPAREQRGVALTDAAFELQRKELARQLCAAYWKDRLPSGEPTGSWLAVADVAIFALAGEPTRSDEQRESGVGAVQYAVGDDRLARAVQPPAPAHRSSEDWRRLTGLWRYGENVLPHPNVSQDFYVWLSLLDTLIDDRAGQAALGKPALAGTLIPDPTIRAAANAYEQSAGEGHYAAIKAAVTAALVAPGTQIDAYSLTTAADIKVARVQDKWAVRSGAGDCLNKSGEWEWEPQPSSRDEAFLARCRFESAHEAIEAALAAADKASA